MTKKLNKKMNHIDIKFNENKKKDLLLIAIIIICIAAVFSVSLNYPILKNWDDQYYILNNTHLTLNFQNILFWISKPYYHMYIPFTMFTYMFDFNIWGYNPIGYHLQNIFWHIIACIFIYKCFRFFNINNYITFFIVLIFSIHPQRVESVVWLSERKDVLCTAFYFATIYFYMKHRSKHKGFSFFAFILYFLAFLAKPMAMSIPFILLAFEFYQHRKINIKQYFNKLWMYFLVLIIFVTIAFQYQATVESKFTLSKQIYIVLYNIIWYIKTSFFPTELNPLYAKISINSTFSYLLTAYISAAILLIYLAVKTKKSFIYIFIPIFFCYLVSLAPVSGFIPWGSVYTADRWSYIPSVFVWFFIAILLSKYLYSRKTAIYNNLVGNKIIYIILSLYTVFLITSNILYQKNWQSSYKIFYRASIFYPTNKYAIWCLSYYELKNKKYTDAFILGEKMAKSTDLADRYRSQYIISSCYFGLEKYQEVINTLEDFLKVEPLLGEKILDGKFFYNNILAMAGISYMKLHRNSKALTYFNKIISANENNQFLNYYYSGMSFMVMENFDKAIYYFKKYETLAPDNILVKKKIEEATKKKNKLNKVIQF